MASNINKREELEQAEERLMSELDTQSAVFEQKAEKVIKTSIVVGASILAGYAIYSVLSNEKPSKKKKKTNYQSGGFFNNPFMKNLMQQTIQRGLELILSDKTFKK